MTIRSSIEGEYYVLTIRDQGRGMTPVQMADIGPYMQFERKWHEQQGSGLGLVISQRLMRLHGGEMRLESTLEKGTSVQIRLPLVKERVLS